MSYRKQLEKIGATPGKLALIGVLSIVLIVVVVKQLPQRTEAKPIVQTASAEISVKKERPQVTKASEPEDLNADKPTHERQPWPETTLAEALVKDPFALPNWAVPEVEEEPEETGILAELQEQGASIVVITSDYKSATVGDYKVHVGDVLEGYRISDITSDGIVLDKLDTR